MAKDKIIEKLLQHDEEFKSLRQEMRDGFNKVNDVLEELVTIVKKIQEDHAFALEWLKRLQDQVEKQEQEIIKIKQQLKLA